MAIDEVRELLPGLTIDLVDSQTAAGGEGLVVLEALREAEEGGGLREVREAAQGAMRSVTVIAFVDTLYYLWKGGRVPRIAHAATSLLQIKPVFELTHGQSSHRRQAQNDKAGDETNRRADAPARGSRPPAARHGDTRGREGAGRAG